MRKVVAGLFITLDGITESPEKWQVPYMDEDVARLLGASLSDADIPSGASHLRGMGCLLAHRGRTEPVRGGDQRPAQAGASTTLTHPGWRNSTVIDGDVGEAIAALKQEPGRDILINGSSTLVRTLLQAGLVDELQLLVHPVVVGDGARLFDGVGQLTMQTAWAETLDNGVTVLAYHPADVLVEA